MGKSKKRAIASLVLVVIFALIGVISYSRGYTWYLFGVVPLSGPVFIGLAAVMIGVGIYTYFAAGKKDKTNRQAFVQTARDMTDGAQPGAQQERLSEPCDITVTRPKKMTGSMYKIAVLLNGIEAGAVENGSDMVFATNLKENDIAVTYGPTQSRGAVHFTAVPGGHVTLETYVDMNAQVRLTRIAQIQKQYN